MTHIDWSKAPEWATQHGYAGPYSREVWFDDEKYTYCDGSQLGMEFMFGTGSVGRTKDEVVGITDRPTTQQWNGEGLPPVGVVCEVDCCESWQRCEVIAHFQQRCGIVAAFTVEYGDGAKSLDAFGADSFRPIRTPEQIAAEERATIIQRMWSVVTTDCSDVIGIQRRVCADLYDAGYRKPDA